MGGATIVVRGSDGSEVDIVTAGNGNFFAEAALSFPVTVRASKCPDDVPMSSPASSGACNSCHGADNRIHLP